MTTYVANPRTVVVRGFGNHVTHLTGVDLNANVEPDDYGFTSLAEWLEMQDWPSGTCGMTGRPSLFCGQRLQTDQPGAIFEAPGTEVTCEKCRDARLRYPMLTAAGAA